MLADFKQNFLKVYKNCLGVVSHACEQCNISRKTFYDWTKADAEFKEAIQEADEATIDWAESSLYVAMKNGNVKATTYFLDAKARARGYGAKLELQHSGIVASPKIEVSKELADKFTDAWLQNEKEKLESSQPVQSPDNPKLDSEGPAAELPPCG